MEVADVENYKAVSNEFISYTIDDNILPGYYPPPPTGSHWPEGIASSIIDLSTAIIFYTPGILLLCTIGNILSILCLKRLYTNVLSTSIYLIMGLIFDTLYVWSRTGLEWIKLAINVNVRDVIASSSLVSCKIFPFLLSSILHISTWTLVAIAVETSWIFQHPQRLFYCINTRRVKITIFVIIVLSFAVNSHCFWTYSIYSSEGRQPEVPEMTCANELTDERIQQGLDLNGDTVPKINSDHRRTIYYIFDLLLTDIIPYFVIFSSSVILITKKCKRKDQLRLLDNTWKVCSIDSDSARQLQTLFIILCVLHSFFLFPKIVLKTFLLLVDAKITGLIPYSIEHKTCTIIAKAVCFTLHYIFTSFKVILFLVSSNLFRRECVHILSCYPKDDSIETVDEQSSTGIPLLTSQKHANHIDTKKQLNDINKSNTAGNHVTKIADKMAIVDDGIIYAHDKTIIENGTGTIKVFSMTSV